jgi:HlyD family secretion protein
VLASGLAAVVGIGGVVVYSVPGMSKPIKGLFAGGKSDIITTVVQKGTLPITVVEKGSLESSENKDAYCLVEGTTTIIFILPEGTPVKKDQVVCQLDSASLKDQLVNQKITTKSAEANHENAKLTREVAEIAVVEYTEGIFKQDLATVEGEIKLAESDLSRSEDRLDWARRMYEKGYVSMATKVSEELTLKKARFALEQAQSKKKVLVDYTKGKTIKELQSEVEKARSDELAKKATWELENSKEKKLEKQIFNCEIKAPADGLVVYANDPNRAFGSSQPQIEEGATVRERQKIFSLPDISRMQVNTKVHESQIDKLGRNMKAKIRVDAFAAETLDGTVTDVAPLPDSTNFFSSDIKVYTTKVKIDVPLSGLKPGMTAEVTILVDRKQDVLTIPVLAVLQYHGKDHVRRKTDDDRFVETEVDLGVSNEKYVEVLKGVAEGDVLALSPMSLMSDDEKRKAFGSASKGGKRDWGEDGSAEAKGAPGGGPPGAMKKVVGVSPAAAKGGDPAKAKAKGKGAGGMAKGKGAGGNRPAFFEKLKSLSQEERTQLRSPDASEEEKSQLYKKAGLTDAELEQMAEMRKSFGGGGGGGGGRRGGGGRPGGGGNGGGGSDQ